MCWDWFKPTHKDWDGTTAPAKGIVVFPDNPGFEQIPSLNVKWARVPIFDNQDFGFVIGRLMQLLNKGVKILATFYTVETAEKYCRKFGKSLVYQFFNEPNCRVNKYMEPFDYINQLKLFRQRLLGIDGSVSVIMAGLNNEVIKNKPDEVIALDYMKAMIPFGLREVTDWLVYHCYSFGDNYYKMRDYCKAYAPEKMVVIGEYGVNSANEAVKIKQLQMFQDKLTKNKHPIAFLYAWMGGQSWGIYNQPKVKEWFSAL